MHKNALFLLKKKKNAKITQSRGQGGSLLYFQTPSLRLGFWKPELTFNILTV